MASHPDTPRGHALANEKLLTGRQKAAVLMMVLGAEAASVVTSRLSPDENEQLALEIASMDAIDVDLANQVVNEWFETTQGLNALAMGGPDAAKEFLEATFGQQRAGTIFKRITSQIADTVGMQRLRNADPQQLGNTLRGEHPQTVAVVLANLDPLQTSSVLKELGGEAGAEVLYRMARMEKVSPEILQMIERSLRADSDLELVRGGKSSGGPEAVAAVLNMLTGSLEKEMLEGLYKRDAALCEQVKNLMFVFEDVVALDDHALREVLQSVDNRTLAVALRNDHDGTTKTKFMALMAKRAAEALQDEIDVLGPTRVKDIEAAQAQIVEQVRKLEETGKIVIAKGGAEDAVV